MLGDKKAIDHAVVCDTNRGQIITGVVHGDVVIHPGGETRLQSLSIPWRASVKDNVQALLEWKSRLPRTLHGRDAEMRQLLAWAEGDDRLGLFLIHGAGGLGKTRLAFELAQTLTERGWQAGELRDPDGAWAFPLGGAGEDGGTLLVLDYPEENRDATRRFLHRLSRMPAPAGRLRVLLLSRNAGVLHDLEGDAGALRDGELALSPLPADSDAAIAHAVELFRDAWTAIQQVRGRDSGQALTSEAIAAWLARDAQHRKPLIILAYALNLSDTPTATELSAGDIIRALVAREVRRLQGEARDLGLPEAGYVLLKALAALSDGLDAEQLAGLMAVAPAHPTLPELEALYRSREARAQRIEPLRPDLLAAQLLDTALAPCQPWVGAWLYQAVTLAGDRQARIDAVSRLARLRHDWAYVLRPGGRVVHDDPWLDALRDHAVQDLARCRTLGPALDRNYLERNLLPLSVAVTRARADAAFGEGEAERAELARSLNNLSVYLAESGDRDGGLAAIRRAVEIYETLAEGNFAAYGPDLAMSLNNQSNRLAESGDRDGGLAAIRRAVEIYETLAAGNFAAYGPVLAQSLYNLAVRMHESGERDAALAHARRALEIITPFARPGTEYADWREVMRGALEDWAQEAGS
ncbi:MAG: ATP-binding protein [Chromatiales bacterium]|nr:ATP-binding protein [Chromatiales bacterium]